MYLKESHKFIDITKLNKYDVIQALYYYKGKLVPHYCIILKIISKSNIIVQCITSSRKWSKNKYELVKDVDVLNLPNKDTKISKILIDYNIPNNSNLNNIRSFSIKHINYKSFKNSTVWHLGQNDINFLEQFYANKNIKLEKEYIYITEDELSEFGLKLKKEKEVNIMEFNDWVDAIDYWKNNIGNEKLKELVLNSLQSSQDINDWTDANTLNLSLEFQNFVEKNSELSFDLNSNSNDLDSQMDIYGDDLFEAAEDLYARYINLLDEEINDENIITEDENFDNVKINSSKSAMKLLNKIIGSLVKFGNTPDRIREILSNAYINWKNSPYKYVFEEENKGDKN